MPATVILRPDERRVKSKSNKYPVKLWVTYDRIPKPYLTVFDLSKEEIDKFSAPNVNGEFKKVRDRLKALKKEAESFIEDLDTFSFEEFEKGFIVNNPLFVQRRSRKIAAQEVIDNEFDFSPYEKGFPLIVYQHPSTDCLSSLFAFYVKELIKQGRIGNASNCHCSCVSLMKFKGNVLISEITISYLIQYETWMKQNMKSRTTIGIYLRALRTIFNEAIAAGVINAKRYPFGRRKFIIPSGKNIKKAFDSDSITQLYFYKPECDEEFEAKDYWMFCYLANGMNPRDVAYLKFKNIHDDLIVFERRKTQLTTKNDPPLITVYLSDDLRSIIDRRGKPNRDLDNYIFAILKPGINPLREHELVQNFIQFINRWMEKIGEKLKLPRKPRTMEARHSFSTMMRNSGSSTELIQESLGHQNIKTTQAYLDSFAVEIKKKFSQNLIPVKPPHAQ